MVKTYIAHRYLQLKNFGVVRANSESLRGSDCGGATKLQRRDSRGLARLRVCEPTRASG